MKNTNENTNKVAKMIEDSYRKSTEYELELKYVFLSWYLYNTNKFNHIDIDMKAVTIADKLINKYGIIIKLDNTPYQFCEDIFISTIMLLPEQVKVL